MQRRIFIKLGTVAAAGTVLPLTALAKLVPEKPLSSMDLVQISRVHSKIGKDLERIYYAVVTGEPNDEITRTELKSAFSAYLNDLHTKRFLYEFMVVCDATNNPQIVLDLGFVGVDAYWKMPRTSIISTFRVGLDTGVRQA